MGGCRVVVGCGGLCCNYNVYIHLIDNWLQSGLSVGGPGQAMKLKSTLRFLLTRQGRVQGQARR